MQKLIQKLDRFCALDEKDRALLESVVVRKRDVPPRTDIIVEGSSPSDVHLITSGFACRYKLIEDGKRQIVAYLLPGDFCDLHVFILKAMDHCIATLSRCTIIDIPRASILQLLERPNLARAMLMTTLVDEATLREWITNIGQRNADLRIAHLFCELHARLAVVGLASGTSYDFPVTQVELGDTVGLSPVHVNRSLQSLRDAGLIVLKGAQLRIPDIGRLKHASGFIPNYLHLSGDCTKDAAVDAP